MIIQPLDVGEYCAPERLPDQVHGGPAHGGEHQLGEDVRLGPPQLGLVRRQESCDFPQGPRLPVLQGPRLSIIILQGPYASVLIQQGPESCVGTHQ